MWVVGALTTVAYQQYKASKALGQTHRSQNASSQSHPLA